MSHRFATVFTMVLALLASRALADSPQTGPVPDDAVDLFAAMDAGDPRAIKRASEALNRVTEPFAARRMDVSVKRALAGQKIASFDS